MPANIRTSEFVTILAILVMFGFAATPSLFAASEKPADPQPTAMPQRKAPSNSPVMFDRALRTRAGYLAMGPMSVVSISPTSLTVASSPKNRVLQLAGKKVTCMKAAQRASLGDIHPGSYVFVFTKGTEIIIELLPEKSASSNGTTNPIAR